MGIKLTSAQFALGLLLASQVLISLPLSTEGANILFFVGFGSTSHRMAAEPLANALADKGHKVTFLAQNKPKGLGGDSKVQYVLSHKVAEFFTGITGGGKGVNFYDLRAGRGGGISLLGSLFTHNFGLRVCESLYADHDILEWLHNTPKIDLIIIDGLYNECAYGFAHVLGAKTIVFSVSTVLPWGLEPFGLPDESAWVPDVMADIRDEMGFYNRLISVVSPIFWRIYRQLYYLPNMQRITQEGLKLEKFPSFVDLERNTSLIFVNTHASQEYARALPPNVIQVGGMSLTGKSKPLPKELQDFINEGKEGFVYVSFGSFIDFLSFPEEVQQTFIRALKQFPNIQFIWKLNKTPENLPKHILVQKWLPQQDILSHPKIHAFITHSGIGGVNEAIYGSVPLICFPVLSEQDYNALIVEKKGFGVKLEITALTEADMVEAIRKLTTDKSYKEAMKKVTQQFLDRPMQPVESAVWWTEFVLRQESTEFLRSQNVDLPWWRKRQLDVWLFVLLLTISLNSLGLYISYKIFKRCFKTKTTNSKLVKGSGKQKRN